MFIHFLFPISNLPDTLAYSISIFNKRKTFGTCHTRENGTKATSGRNCEKVRQLHKTINILSMTTNDTTSLSVTPKSPIELQEVFLMTREHQLRSWSCWLWRPQIVSSLLTVIYGLICFCVQPFYFHLLYTVSFDK